MVAAGAAEHGQGITQTQIFLLVQALGFQRCICMLINCLALRRCCIFSSNFRTRFKVVGFVG